MEQGLLVALAQIGTGVATSVVAIFLAGQLRCVGRYACLVGGAEDEPPSYT